MMTRSNLFTVLTFVVGGALAGCAGQGAEEDQQEIIENLIEAGYPAEDIEIVEGMVYVQKDAHVTLQASREMLETDGSAEQYRTTNLVGSGVTKICVNPTSGFTSRARLSAGLDLAIQNYNQLNLQFVFARGTAPDCDAVIAAKVGGPTGGSAGFPSGGLPYGQIQIGSSLNNYSVDVNEHVITHELGHCIGLRHSDYFNRSISCGSGGNEGAGSIGAIHISGTPTGATVGGSIMNSCFRSTENGELTSSDVTAFNALY